MSIFIEFYLNGPHLEHSPRPNFRDTKLLESSSRRIPATAFSGSLDDCYTCGLLIRQFENRFTSCCRGSQVIVIESD